MALRAEPVDGAIVARAPVRRQKAGKPSDLRSGTASYVKERVCMAPSWRVCVRRQPGDWHDDRLHGSMHASRQYAVGSTQKDRTSASCLRGNDLVPEIEGV